MTDEFELGLKAATKAMCRLCKSGNEPSCGPDQEVWIHTKVNGDKVACRASLIHARGHLER